MYWRNPEKNQGPQRVFKSSGGGAKVRCYCQLKAPPESPELIQMQELCSLTFLDVQKGHLQDTSGDSKIKTAFSRTYKVNLKKYIF